MVFRIIIAAVFALILTGGYPPGRARSQEAAALFPVEQNNKWGFIDRQGKVIVPIKFDGVNNFHEGLALVTIGGQKAFIDVSGRIVITPKFDIVNDFSEGLAAVNTGQVRNSIGLIASPGKWGYIDKIGRLMIPQKFSHAENFSEGLAAVNLADHDRGAFIDHSGNIVFEVPLDVSVGFHEGLVGVLLNGTVAYYDRSGKKLPIATEYGPKTNSFSEGLLPIEVKNKWGYVDKAGRLVIAPQFEDAESFREGLAPVKVHDEQTTWCPADPAGNRSGFTMRWGYIDKTGKFIIPAQFESAGAFSEGLAPIDNCDRAFFIDKTGKRVIDRNFRYAYPFSSGLARVETMENDTLQSAYIDHAGRIVWGAPR